MSETRDLTWRQYQSAIIATALGVFWLVAAARVKTEKVQATERRTANWAGRHGGSRCAPEPL